MKMGQKPAISTSGIKMGGLIMYGIKEMSKLKDKYERDFAEVVSKQDGSHATPLAAFFVGGKYHGLYMTHKELKAKGNGKFTPRWSAMKYHNSHVSPDLEDQPMIDGYLSPMLDGGRLRYETQEVYDLMFD